MEYFARYVFFAAMLRDEPGNEEALRGLVDVYADCMSDHEVRDSIALYVTNLGGEDIAAYLQKKISESSDEFLRMEFRDWLICIARDKSIKRD